MRLSVHSDKSLKFLPKNGKHHIQGHHWKNPPSMKQRRQQANYTMDNPTLQEPKKYEEADSLIATLVNGVIKVKPDLKLQSGSQQDKGQKIVIVGDSHARDLARNVKYYLNENYRCSGFVKPGVNINTLMSTVNEEIKPLTYSDMMSTVNEDIKPLTYSDTIVVLGGTEDVNKNNAYE